MPKETAVEEADRHDVQRLLEQGAQLVEVLPLEEFEDARLPGAVHIPLKELAARQGELDRDRPVVVYCYDSLCDMSPRGAARLVGLGFHDVHDYVGSKVDWIGAGLPYEGTRADRATLASLADPSVPTCGLDTPLEEVRAALDGWDTCVVVDDERVVLGVLRGEALDEGKGRAAEVMREAPVTFRPHMTPAELAGQLRELPRKGFLVTNLDGTLVGLARTEEVRAHVHRQEAG